MNTRPGPVPLRGRLGVASPASTPSPKPLLTRSLITQVSQQLLNLNLQDTWPLNQVLMAAANRLPHSGQRPHRPPHRGPHPNGEPFNERRIPGCGTKTLASHGTPPASGFSKPARMGPPPALKKDGIAENARLRRENQELRDTNELLKAASAFSPQNSPPPNVGHDPMHRQVP